MKPLAIASAAALALGIGVTTALLTMGGERHPAGTTSSRKRAPEHPRRRPGVAWPTYGFDPGRTHAAPYRLRPPFRRLWAAGTDSSFIEFPPTVGYGRLYVGTNHGRVLALDAASGRLVWRRDFGRCVASSTALAHGVLYVTFMAPPPCRADTSGLLAALDPRTGRVLWRLRTAVTESSPLIVGALLYFGAWDGRVYAVDLRTHGVRWSFETGDRVKAGAAYAGGTIYIGSYDGRLYALEARTGRVRWTARGGQFYATPSVADGRVLVGSLDGTVYAYRTSDGALLWSRRTASFVYSAAAVWRGTVYVGSYDHRLYALDAATGALRWTFDAGAPISGAPTVVDGLVYFSSCGSCSKFEQNPRARRSFALDARTGRLVWTFADGEYSPVVADGTRLYLTGLTTVYALAPERR